MKTLLLRDEIFAAAHRWPIIMTSFLVGSLIGILAAYLWPSPYRATQELLVGLNPYRAENDNYVAEITGVSFRNADDYKYWQMQQLNALVFSNEYLEETLSRLKNEDAFWQESTAGDLREILQVYWRNAGRWRLTADVGELLYAAHAVETWQDVIIEKTNVSISHAQEILLLDLELQALNESLIAAKTHLVELIEIEAVMIQWREDIIQSHVIDPFDEPERWWLMSLAARAAGMDLGWQSLLDSIPSSTAPADAYIEWVEQLMIAIEGEAAALSSQIPYLEGERDKIFNQWEVALQEGDGLAATLAVEELGEPELKVRRLRPTYLAALVGGIIGLLVWGAITLMRIDKGLVT